jgi:hypothetical protein
MSNTDDPQHTSLTSPCTPVYPFTSAELARLAHYRAAVQAGFYSDAVSQVPTCPANETSGLLPVPFTRSELTRLVARSNAISDELYSEFCDERRSA